MNLTRLGASSIGGGIVLILVSFAWKPLVPQNALWSKDRAAELQAASAQLHHDSHDRDLAPEKLAESQAKFDALQTRLDRAVAMRTSTPFYLRIAGILIGVVGIGLILTERSQQS